MLVFLADGLLVAWTAWIGLGVSGLARRGLVEGLLGWGLLTLAWIAGSGVLLGLVGALGRPGFLLLHALALGAVLVWRRRTWREDLRSGRDWLTEWRRWLFGGSAAGWITGGLVVVVAFLALLAAQAEPIVYDALTYRLSRIAAWLQDGSIRHFPTDDPRLNYMPVAPDVVIAWLLGAANEGFRLAPLAQLAGGVLLMGATAGLARSIGLSRLQALGAVGVLLGMANVAAQFTTLQSDLFTAGVFAAAYLLWHRAWLRGEGSWVAGLGVALAFGSKGTMFYLAPGAALWVGWLMWRQRREWRAVAPTAAGIFFGMLVLAAPGYWRNQATYGAALGPRDAVVLHHGSFDSPAQHADKLVRNLGTSAVQLFEPTAQPFWLQGMSRAAGEKLTARLSAEADPYVFIGQSRRDQVERVMRLQEPDADVVTGGLLATGLFFGGLLLAAVRPRREGAAQILVWGAGVILYLLVQHGLVQWHHWAFRFMVMASPWAAVIGAWGLAGLPGKLRLATWAVVLVSAVQVFALVQVQTSQAAWQATTQPGRAASFYQYSHWRTWAGRLDRPEEPLRLAFPIDRPLAAFYRLAPARVVSIGQLSALHAETAEVAVGTAPGWLVVPAERFMGREGRVLGRSGPFNVAAYRALAAGERPQPLLYEYRSKKIGEKTRDELLLRTWVDVPVRLEFTNPDGVSCDLELRSPTAVVAHTVPAGGKLTVDVPMPADVLCWVTIDFAGEKPAGLRSRLLP